MWCLLSEHTNAVGCCIKTFLISIRACPRIARLDFGILHICGRADTEVSPKNARTIPILSCMNPPVVTHRRHTA